MRSLRASIVAMFAFLLLPLSAEGQPLDIHVEAGGALMLSDYQRSDLGFDGLGPAAAARIGWRMSDWLSVQLGGEWVHFPSDLEAGGQVAFVAGLRVQPRLGSAGRLFLDINGGAARSDDVTRPSASVGLGFEIALSSTIGLGPFLRYGRTFAAENDVPTDAQFLTGGLTFAFHGETGPAEAEPEPPADSDGDGIPDAEDPCPDAVPGATPDPERPGCPVQDSDGDGIADSEDACPRTPQLSDPDPERPGCPAGDQDGDGLPDPQDNCPAEPQGDTPDPERPGCPAPDRDGDTVPDAEDACPDEAGAPSTDAERNGCPSLARVQDDRIEALEPIYFALNSARILPRSQPTLEAIADVLRARPALQVSIEGHTDQTGSPEYNLQLSQERADAVMQSLVRSGIDASRLQARGFGQTRPAVDDDHPDAAAKNRRVEFRIQQ